MSTHRDCGAEIRWFRRDDDSERFMPPMELAGEGYVIIDEKLEYRTVYRIHQCDPDVLVEWQAYLERLAEAKGEEVTPYEATKSRHQDEQWEVALLVACRTCHMLPGEKCVSQLKQLKATGEIVNTKWPHPDRLEEGYAFKEALQ